MSLMKKIIFGMSVAIFANASMVEASDLPETKDNQTNQRFMEHVDKISKPIIEKIDKYGPNYTTSAYYFTGLNAIPLVTGYFMKSKARYGLATFATVVPIANTYFLYQFHKKMEALSPSPTEHDDCQEPYKNKKLNHLLNGGIIVGSTLATTCTKKYIALTCLCYSLVASAFQGVSLKLAGLNSAIQENKLAREENSRERLKFIELLHRSKDT